MKYCVILLLIAHCSFVYAQPAPIDTDRPDLTESAVLVPVKWLQFEAGFSYQKNDRTENEYLTPSLLSKYGLLKCLELRLITSLISNTSTTTLGRVRQSGLDVVEVGAKVG